MMDRPERSMKKVWLAKNRQKIMLVVLALLFAAGLFFAPGIAAAQLEIQSGSSEKEALQAHMETIRQMVPPAPKDPKAGPEVPHGLVIEESPVSSEGIYEGSGGLIRPSFINVQNMWERRDGGAGMQVFAGSEPEEASQGIIIVIDARELGRRDTQSYLAPGKTGPLRILSVEAGVVTLLQDDGSIIAFDLESRLFR